MRRRTLIIIALALFFCLSVPALAVYWLCYTQTGLQWLAARVSGMQKIRMEFHGLTGQLRGPIHIDRFELDQERVHVIAINVTADVRLRRIFLQTIEADYLNIASLEVRLKPRTTPPTPTPPHFLPQWLRINAHAVSVPEVKLILTSGRELEAKQVRTGAIMTNDRLKVSGVSGSFQQLTLGGDATLDASQPLRMKGAVAWTYALPDQPRWAGQVQVDGDLDRLLASGSVTEPLNATFDAQLLDLTQAWHWEANVQASDFTLKPWSPQSPVSIPSASFTGQGGGEQLQLRGTLSPRFPETGALNLTFEGKFAQRTLHADVLQVAFGSDRATLSTSGDIAFLGGWPQLNLKGRWTDLGYPFLGKALSQSTRGEFSLDGKVPYRYTVSADVAGWSKRATLSSHGLFERDAITWEDLRASILGGKIQSTGSLGFGGKAPWKVSATAQGLAPQQLDVRFPGRVGFELEASGRGFDRSAQLELRLRELRGELREQPLGGHAHLRLADGTLKVDDTDLSFGAAHLQAHGDYGTHPSLSWDLNIPDFAQLLPDARGSVTSRGTLSGTRAEPQLSGTLSALRVEFGAYQLGRLEAQGKVDLADRSASQLQVSGTSLKWGMRELNSLDVTIDGRASAHQVNIKADAEGASLLLRADSAYADETLAGTINRFDLNLSEAHLRLAALARFTASREHAGLEQLCLNGTVERTCAQGEWRSAGTRKVALDASGLPLKILGAGLPKQSQYSGVLSAHANASADAGKPWTGEAQATLADGVFRYHKSNGKIESVTVGSGETQLTAT